MLQPIESDIAHKHFGKVLECVVIGQQALRQVRGTTRPQVPYFNRPEEPGAVIARGPRSQVSEYEGNCVVQEIDLTPIEYIFKPCLAARRLWVGQDFALQDKYVRPLAFTTYSRDIDGKPYDLLAIYYPRGEPVDPFAMSDISKFTHEVLPPLLDSMTATSEAGYLLGDVIKGSNFVRFPGGRVLWVDAESVTMDSTLEEGLSDGLTTLLENQVSRQMFTMRYTPSSRIDALLEEQEEDLSRDAGRATDTEQAGLMLANDLFGLHEGTQFPVDSPQAIHKGARALEDERSAFIEEDHSSKAGELSAPGLDTVVKDAMTGRYPSLPPFRDDVCRTLNI